MMCTVEPQDIAAQMPAGCRNGTKKPQNVAALQRFKKSRNNMRPRFNELASKQAAKCCGSTLCGDEQFFGRPAHFRRAGQKIAFGVAVT